MQHLQLQHKKYRQLIFQLTVSSYLLFFTVLLTGSTPAHDPVDDLIIFKENTRPVDAAVFLEGMPQGFMRKAWTQRAVTAAPAA